VAKHKCCECEHGKYFERSNGYVCKHEECKEIHIFKGKTKPHYCPLSGGKKYTIHKNLGRNSGALGRDVLSFKVIMF
jgi:hypothetical protein